jgi:hypothetical protein
MSFRPWARLAGIAALYVLAACGGGDDTQTTARSDDAPSNTLNICAIFAEKPHWRSSVQAASQRYGTPVPVMMGIMWRESRFRQHASPGTSSAYGYAQAINSTWDWYKDATGNRRARRDNFADAADFVGWYMTQTVRQNGLAPHDSFAHYLAYHEGHRGFTMGTFWQKEFLLNAAAQVQTMSGTYALQLSGCPSRRA